MNHKKEQHKKILTDRSIEITYYELGLIVKESNILLIGIQNSWFDYYQQRLNLDFFKETLTSILESTILLLKMQLKRTIQVAKIEENLGRISKIKLKNLLIDQYFTDTIKGIYKIITPIKQDIYDLQINNFQELMIRSRFNKEICNIYNDVIINKKDYSPENQQDIYSLLYKITNNFTTSIIRLKAEMKYIDNISDHYFLCYNRYYED